jgi:hypothetical protein
VLWTRKSTGIDVRRGLPVVNIAIANPEHAPYGRAAVAALQHEKLYDGVRAKFVVGENISHAAEFAQSGNAEVGDPGAIACTRADPRDSGAYMVIPSSFYPLSAHRASGRGVEQATRRRCRRLDVSKSDCTATRVLASTRVPCKTSRTTISLPFGLLGSVDQFESRIFNVASYQ